jgi:hypothetical protein
VWVTVYPVTTLPLYWRVFHKLELSAMAYLEALRPALTGSLLMSWVVWALKQTLLHESTALARLTATVLAGAAVYVLVAMTWHREHLRSFHYALQTIRGSAS